MKKEDKELLLRDLCARLPYNTIVCMAEGGVNGIKWNKVELTLSLLNQIEEEGAWEFVKPYLRPMSSMTEEEIDELKRICDEDDSRDEYGEVISTVYGMTVLHGEVEDVYPYNVRIEISPNLNYAVLDFLNAHHLDYRGLILMGLALEALDGMYDK